MLAIFAAETVTFGCEKRRKCSMNKPTKRLRSILLLGAALMVSGPVAAIAQPQRAEVGPSVVVNSPNRSPMSEKKADMKEVIINVFGMT